MRGSDALSQTSGMICCNGEPVGRVLTGLGVSMPLLLLERPWPHENMQIHEARYLDSLHRLLFHDHTSSRYCVGLLLGLGIIVYIFYSIKRGYILGRLEKSGYAHIFRKQDPLSFWTSVVSCLLIGSLVVAVCVAALWKGVNAF